MKNILRLIPLLFIFVSCTKEIELDLNAAHPHLVIEGSITDAEGPYYVKLSKTVNFSSSNTYPPVSGAQVIIQDMQSNISDTLTESMPGLYQTRIIAGQQGHTYKLKVFAEGEEYTAISTMPAKTKLDSLRVTKFMVPDTDELFAMIPVYTDPEERGNFYRFFQSLPNETDKSYLITNDNIGNGATNQKPILSRGFEIKKGDTVTITMMCIDQNTYNYFYTLAQVSGSGPGGGTTPTNPPSNLTGEYVLGIFSAFSTEEKTIIVQ